jgi:hypothetical protein
MKWTSIVFIFVLFVAFKVAENKIGFVKKIEAAVGA